MPIAQKRSSEGWATAVPERKHQRQARLVAPEEPSWRRARPGLLRRRGPALRGALAALCVIVTAAGLALANADPAGAASSTTHPQGGKTRLVAAAFFGTANPINFWSSDLSGAKAAFRQIKSNGFNAVDLVLPWGDFEPSLTPPKFNKTDFSRLDQLISLANKEHLSVLLRLSYEFDVYPNDQMSWTTRQEALYGNPAVYQAWLDYIGKVRQSVSRFHNIKAVYLSWEDFWAPVWETQAAKTPVRRLRLATTTGYRRWLRTNYTLADVELAYGTKFASWAQVPTPAPDAPSYALIYKYVDWMMIHRFFADAQKRFPQLTLEARVDSDSVRNGTQVVGTYSHDATYRLPGTTTTGMYYSPYMKDPSTSHNETASQAIQGLHSVLSSVASQSAGRRLYIYEFEFVSNAAIISSGAQLGSDQVVPFLRQSAPLLEQYTNGYTVWTYRDFNESPVYNPSFSVGMLGWQAQGKTKVVKPSGSTAYLSMEKGSSVTQTVPPLRLKVPSSSPVTVSVQASTTRGTSSLTLKVGSATSQVTVHPGWHTYQMQVPGTQLGTGQVTLSASGPLRVTNVQVYGFTQVGDVYRTDGSPGQALGAIRSLNHQLTSTPVPASS